MLLKRILWTLVPIVASKLLRKRRGSTANIRADKTRYDKNTGR
ncbi:hypothetical protein [Arthrobacter sp. H20]|nr:hypothetical protein [Arthrobacter sp. H20]